MKKCLACLLFIFSTALIFAQKVNYNADLIPNNLKESANSCVRSQSINVEIKSQKKYKITKQKIVTVFNKNGISNIDAREYFDKSNTVNSMDAVVYNGAGVVIKKIKKSDFIDQSVADGFSIYSNDRVLFLNYTPVEYPFTIVYNSEMESSNTAFLPRWFPLDDYYESVLYSTFSITYPPDLGFKLKEFNFDNRAIIKTEVVNKVLYTVENIPAEKPEFGTHGFENTVPKVIFAVEKFNLEGIEGEAKNWQDFGLWMNKNLLSDVSELTDETKLKMKNLVVNEKDNFSKAKLIYNYVQNKTRYVSIQLGIGGWKPMLAKDVDRLGYGDCKALTNYTCALLKAVEIPSYYTLIYAGDNQQDIDENFVAMQGNHAILTLPINNTLHFLECTNQTLPFAFEGNFTDDRKALIIKPSGGEIINTQLFSENTSTQIVQGSYEIDENGLINCSVQIKSKGIQYDDVYQLENKSATQLDAYYKSYFSWISNLKLQKPTFLNNKEAVEFTSNLKFSASDYGKFSANLLIFPLNIFNRGGEVPPRYRNRKNYFEVQRGFTDIDEIEISIPSTFKVDTKPENFLLDEKFGSYKFEIITLSETKLLYKRSLICKKGLWDKNEYENYRIFKEQIAKADNSKIVITKK